MTIIIFSILCLIIIFIHLLIRKINIYQKLVIKQKMNLPTKNKNIEEKNYCDIEKDLIEYLNIQYNPEEKTLPTDLKLRGFNDNTEIKFNYNDNF